MPVQYVMIYLDRERWEKHEILPAETRRKIKKKLQTILYKEIQRTTSRNKPLSLVSTGNQRKAGKGEVS